MRFRLSPSREGSSEPRRFERGRQFDATDVAGGLGFAFFATGASVVRPDCAAVHGSLGAGIEELVHPASTPAHIKIHTTFMTSPENRRESGAS
jgi:hypothetical protein